MLVRKACLQAFSTGPEVIILSLKWFNSNAYNVSVHVHRDAPPHMYGDWKQQGLPDGMMKCCSIGRENRLVGVEAECLLHSRSGSEESPDSSGAPSADRACTHPTPLP